MIKKKLFIIKKELKVSGNLKKAISPLMATVILLALTLAVGGILGSWFVSMSRTEMSVIEEKMIEQINCTGALEIVLVTCNITTNELKIVLQNIANDINLYDFSTFALINSIPYTNSTGGPNSTHPLGPGRQDILTYGCGDTYCPGNSTVSKVRVSPGNCPKGWLEIDADVACVA